jgi:hypothetical protein
MFYLALAVTGAIVYWIVQKFPAKTATIAANITSALPFVLDDLMNVFNGVDYEKFMSPAQASAMGIFVAMLNVCLRYKYGAPHDSPPSTA